MFPAETNFKPEWLKTVVDTTCFPTTATVTVSYDQLKDINNLPGSMLPRHLLVLARCAGLGEPYDQLELADAEEALASLASSTNIIRSRALNNIINGTLETKPPVVRAPSGVSSDTTTEGGDRERNM